MVNDRLAWAPGRCIETVAVAAAISTPTKSAYVCAGWPVFMALSTLHTSYAFIIRLGSDTPSGCQSSSARDAWSRPHDTVQSFDNLGSWGTLFASRSEPPLSPGPHHDPGVLLMIQAMLILIIRAVIQPAEHQAQGRGSPASRLIPTDWPVESRARLAEKKSRPSLLRRNARGWSLGI